MAKIRVDVGHTIWPGSEIKFRSPVDCTDVTGLIVYYPDNDGNTVSKEFAFADAHGNNVGDIPHLFSENVVVKVILDIATGMAFVQNADTNAYLENQLAQKAPIDHISNKNNPHGITAEQIGAVPTVRTINGYPLTEDIVLYAEDFGSEGNEGLNAHIRNKNNPHSVTAEQIGAAMSPKTASGAIVAVGDSSDAPLRSLKLYGKTTQNGTPSPETPAELVSAGAGGSIGVTVAGKNLLECVPMNITTNGLTITTGADGRYTLNGTTTAAINPVLCPYTPGTRTCIPAGTYTLSGHPGTANLAKLQIPVYPDNETTTFLELISLTHSTPTRTVTFPKPVYLGVYLYGDAGVTYANAVYAPAIEIGANKTEYEPYKEQTLTASTPNGLPGIPVESGGNYTDENGQVWICDEIDFARGVYVKRIAVIDYAKAYPQKPYRLNTYYSGKYRFVLASDALKAERSNQVVPLWCNILSADTADHTFVATDSIAYAHNGNQILFYVEELATSTGEEALAWLQEKQVKIQYILATTTETALSEEELAQYAELHTNKPNTTVYNDAGAHMEIGYYTPTSALPVAGGAMGGNIRMAGNRITDLADPVCDGDAASKAYVDSKVSNSSKVFEDSTYTGCYYRLVDGVVEWLNPPGVVGVAYRTSERYKGYPVWVKTIFVGDATANTLKGVQYLNEDEYPNYFAEAFRVCATGYDFSTQTIPNVVAHSEDGSLDYTVVITPTVDMSDIYATVWYIRAD